MSQAPARRWQCLECGDIYDESRGIPEEGIAPGTRFEDIPSDWHCPNCGAAKDSYVLLEA